MGEEKEVNSSREVPGMEGIVPRKHYIRRATSYLHRVSVPVAMVTAVVALVGGVGFGADRLVSIVSGPPTQYTTPAVSITTHSSDSSVNDAHSTLNIPASIIPSNNSDPVRYVTVTVYNRTNHQEQDGLLVFTDEYNVNIHGDGGRPVLPAITGGQGVVSPPHSNEIDLGVISPHSSKSTTFIFKQYKGYARVYSGSTYQAEVGF